MRTTLTVFFVTIAIFFGATAGGASDFISGADVSFLPQVEAGGGVFLAGGQPTDCLTILHDHGITMARLRLWHSPADGHSGLAEVLAMAERTRAAGLDLLLDFHYSDTWADPAHQTKPSAWTALSFAALQDSVRAYTRNALAALAAQDLVPEIVQVGNEITSGLLWDEGRVGGSFDTTTQWANLGDLLQAAIDGIDDALPGDLRPEIMIHIDRGGANLGARWFYDNLIAQGVGFDLIGLSYYPWWHGSLGDFEANIDDLATRYGKGLVLVETAYPWTLGWFDNTHNPVGLPEHLLPGYDGTPTGQQAFLAAVIGIVRTAPGDLGRGVFWWEPQYIATPGSGSSWENVTLFDDQGAPLPALDEFAPPVSASPAPLPTGLHLAPNPFQYETTLSLRGELEGPGKFEVFDVRGRLLASGQTRNESGSWTWRPTKPAAGVYFFRLSTGNRCWFRRATLIP